MDCQVVPGIYTCLSKLFAIESEHWYRKNLEVAEKDTLLGSESNIDPPKIEAEEAQVQNIKVVKRKY